MPQKNFWKVWILKEWSFRTNIISFIGNNNQGSHTDWKTWKNGKTFSSQGKVREFCADWKSQGNLDKILEKSGKFREFLFFVLFLIELYLLKWIKFSVFRPTWWVSSVVIQFGESWCPTACTCSPSTDSILGLLLTSYTIWVGWPWEELAYILLC